MTLNANMALLLACAVLVGGNALADDATATDPRQMTEEEREALRAERRAEWEAMSDEERAAAIEQRKARRDAHRAEARQRWENMSDEERAAHRERMQKRRDAGDRDTPAEEPAGD